MAVQLENLQKPDEPPLIFISYSHKDEIWKDRLRPHLGLLERDDRIIIWDDRQIEPTAEWYDQIKRVMARASIAVCLISADYLNSEFCTKEEIPYLLRRRKEEGMHLFLVLLRPCAWQALSWLKTLQMLPRDGKSVASDFKDDWDTPFAELATYVFGNPPKVAPIKSRKRGTGWGSLRRPAARDLSTTTPSRQNLQSPMSASMSPAPRYRRGAVRAAARTDVARRRMGIGDSARGEPGRLGRGGKVDPDQQMAGVDEGRDLAGRQPGLWLVVP